MFLWNGTPGQITRSRVPYAARAEHTTRRPTFRVEQTPHVQPHNSTPKQYDRYDLGIGALQPK